jgi:hypothetical protein
LWRILTADRASAYETPFAGIALTAWVSVLGFLVVEIFGSMSSLIEDTERLYRAHVRNGMLAMGFDLDLVKSTSV